MIDQTVEVRTDSLPVEVWAFVAEGYFENHPKWDPAIVGMEKLSPGPIGKGSTGREMRKFMGVQATDFEITEYEAPHRFAFRNKSGPFQLERAYEIRPNGAGTKVTFTFRMRPRAFPLTLLFPLIQRTIEKQVQANIERLRDLLG